MKRSSFTLEIPDGDKTILYSTLHSSVIRLDKEYYEKYQRILEGKEEESDEECKAVLADENLIVENDRDEWKEFFEEQERIRLSEDELILSILPTTACNMKCAYCFEDLEPTPAYEGMEDDLMDFVRRYCEKKPVQKIDVCWYGGEPLLDIGLIHRASARLIAYAKEKGIKYEANMITNGILLTKEAATELKEKCLITNYQITLDGPREVHNKSRVYRAGDGFTTILENITANLGNIGINVRINLGKENLGHLEELIEVFEGIEHFKENVVIYISKIFGDTPLCLSNQVYYRRNLEVLAYLSEKGFYVNESQYFPVSLPVPCAVLTDRNFVIDPDGDLYRCGEVAGMKQYSFATLKSWTGTEKNRFYTEFKYPDKCSGCAMLPICHSGKCIYRRSNNTADCQYTETDLKEIIDFFHTLPK